MRTLQPYFRPYATMLYRYARALDNRFVVTSTRRTIQEQARLYERFLAGKSGGLPAAPPGKSKHEMGLALDVARFGIDPLKDELLPKLGAAWRAAGGRWFASDPVHFEV